MSDQSTTIIVAVVVSVVLLITFSLLFFWVRRRRQQSAAPNNRKRLRIGFSGSDLIQTGVIEHEDFLPIRNQISQNNMTPKIEMGLPKALELKKDQDYRVHRLLAVGTAASIFVGEILNGALVKMGIERTSAVKIIDDNKTSETQSWEIEEEKEKFKNEVSILWTFREHPSFAKIYGVTWDPMIIVMKLYSLGNLSDLISHPSPDIKLYSAKYDLPLVVDLAIDIAYGLSALHNIGVIYNDLQSTNVLLHVVSGHLKAVLCDFGVSRTAIEGPLVVTRSHRKRIIGDSAAYTSPELIQLASAQVLNKKIQQTPVPLDYHLSADVYSFGLTLFEMMARKFPWQTQEPKDIIKAVLNNVRPIWPLEVFKWKMEDEVVKALVSIAERCWRQSPAERPPILSVHAKLCEIKMALSR